MAFTYDLGTNRGAVRFRISDTKPDGALFDDAEIDFALTEGGSVAKAVCILARQRIAWLSRRPASESTADGRSIDWAGQLAVWRELLAQYGGAQGEALTLPSAVVDFGGYVPSDAVQPLSEMTSRGLP